jgi:hypothetical protein
VTALSYGTIAAFVLVFAVVARILAGAPRVDGVLANPPRLKSGRQRTLERLLTKIARWFGGAGGEIVNDWKRSRHVLFVRVVSLFVLCAVTIATFSVLALAYASSAVGIIVAVIAVCFGVPLVYGVCLAALTVLADANRAFNDARAEWRAVRAEHRRRVRAR